MKKLLVLMLAFFCFGCIEYYRSIDPMGDMLEDFNIGKNGLRWNAVVIKSGETHIEAERRVVLFSNGSILLSVKDGINNKIEAYLPTSPNGEEKTRGTLWFCELTNTVKFEPINTTCGGFDGR